MPGRVAALAFGNGPFVDIGRSWRGAQLQLSLAIQYEIVDDPDDGPYRVTTRGYIYGVRESRTGDDVVGYHWHPRGSSHARVPHLHVGSAAITPDGVLTPKSHLPTARVTLESVIRLCIEEFGVEPLRPDWDQVLRDSEDVHKMFRSWSDVPSA